MGKLAEIKTKPTSSSVAGFIDSLPDEQKRKDSLVIIKLMEKATKEKLLQQGFNFYYFTNIDTTKGSSCYFCFEYGYHPLKDNYVRLVKR